MIIIDESVNNFIGDLKYDIERIEELMEEGYLEDIGLQLIEKLRVIIEDIRAKYRNQQ
jgi:hypothetical protein